MHVLVTGARGQLGSDVVSELMSRNIYATGIDITELDITDAFACKDFISKKNSEKRIDAIIHCAAYTAVDKAEDEVETAARINAYGTENLVKVCKEFDIKFMYISTDYVFDGEGDAAFKPDDKRAPLNVYGQTKYEGELAVEKYLEKYFIVRISWVFGLNGNNFINTMLKLGRTKDSLNIVSDQIGSPTYTKDLAVLLSDMIVTDKYGRYHATNEGLCSWYEFAMEIFKQAGITDIKVNPVSSEEFPVKAKRPHNSRMDKIKLTENGFKLMPTWQDALSRYLKDIGE